MLPVKVLVLFFILLQCTHYHWSLKIRPILYPILHNHASFSSQQLSLAKKNIANNGITSTIQQSSIEPNFRNHTLKRFSTMLTHWANLFFPRHDSPTSLQSTNSTACNNDKYSQHPKRNLPFSRSRLSEFVHSSLYTKAGIIRTISFLILIILNSSFLASQFRKKTTAMEVPYSMFLRLLKEKPGSIERLKVSSSGIISFFLQNNPNRCITRQVHISDNLMQQLLQQGVDFSASPPPLKPVPVVFSLVYLGFIWNIAKKILRNFQDDGAGKSKEALNLDRFGDLSFDDFAGQESAKREVQEICHMLHEPEKYLSVGARLPTGVLLVGPPGSGKTLLARVAAREAQVPFFACSATDFVEVFVGRGAARVRKLFKQAAKQVPCILFIDELDSIGRTRRTGGSSSSLGNNAETENTLNALLTMMDGLDTSQSGIIVIAATNRVETLDPALLRAGRFDRIVHCPLPDTNGRKAILETHIRQRGIRLQGVNVNNTVVSDESASELKNESDTEDSSFQESSDSYDFSKDSNWLNDIVRHTKGFSGADLATLLNEAAIRAARRYIDNNSISEQVKYVTESDFDSALRSFLSTRPTLASQNIAYLASNPKFLMESILATDKIANEEKQHLNEHSGKVISSMVDIRRFWSTLFTLAKEKLHIPPTN